MDVDKLVVMSNQLGSFFAAQAENQAIEQIAEHLRNFWDPSMRAALIKHAHAGGAGLHPLVQVAVRGLES